MAGVYEQEEGARRVDLLRGPNRGNVPSVLVSCRIVAFRSAAKLQLTMYIADFVGFWGLLNKQRLIQAAQSRSSGISTTVNCIRRTFRVPSSFVILDRKSTRTWRLCATTKRVLSAHQSNSCPIRRICLRAEG